MERLPRDPAARASRRGPGGPGPAGVGRARAALTAPAAPAARRQPEHETVRAKPDVVTLVLWRHGQTAYNAERRFQGQTDIPLNSAGVAQAARAARYLAALQPDAIFSSDLSRAAQTAAALARLTGLGVTLDKDLRERHGGAWEGLTDTEIREQYPEAYASWVPPDGESAEAVADRSSAALGRIAEILPLGSLAVVAGHGANLGLGLGRLLGIPDGVRMLGPFGNCRWSVAGRRLGAWRLLEHNVGSLPVPVPERDAEPVSAPGRVPGAERED